jgi:cytosine/creatinine deaminase
VDPLPDLSELSDDELERLIAALKQEDDGILSRRRLLHGKLDILRAERTARLKTTGGYGGIESPIESAAFKEPAPGDGVSNLLASPPAPDDQKFLDAAIEQARIGRDEGGVPIGAALAVDGQLLAVGRNRRVQMGSAIRHGETDALENAGRLKADVYRRATMATTLSPCDMCTGAILLYGIPRVVIGENETFRGPEELLLARGVELVHLRSGECRAMMEDFIAAHPELWNEDIGE